MLDHAAVHDGDAVGDGHGLLLIVGDVDGGDAHAVLNLADGVAHLDAQLGVEVGERLVHEQHVRLDDDGAGERDALLLAAGEALGQAVGVLGDLDRLEDFIDAAPDLVLGQMAVFEAEGDVLAHGHVRKDGIVLEDHADVALVGRDVVDDPSVEGDGAALDGVEAGDHAQQRGLAAAGGAEQREELALAHVEAEAGDDDIFAILLDDVFKVDGYAHGVSFLSLQVVGPLGSCALGPVYNRKEGAAQPPRPLAPVWITYPS